MVSILQQALTIPLVSGSLPGFSKAGKRRTRGVWGKRLLPRWRRGPDGRLYQLHATKGWRAVR